LAHQAALGLHRAEKRRAVRRRPIAVDPQQLDGRRRQGELLPHVLGRVVVAVFHDVDRRGQFDHFIAEIGENLAGQSDLNVVLAPLALVADQLRVDRGDRAAARASSLDMGASLCGAAAMAVAAENHAAGPFGPRPCRLCGRI